MPNERDYLVAVEDVARKFVVCFEHAGSCYEWCKLCEQQNRSIVTLDKALNDLDEYRTSSKCRACGFIESEHAPDYWRQHGNLLKSPPSGYVKSAEEANDPEDS
jgi:hypothetical protein